MKRYCPGPCLPALPVLSILAFLFVVSCADEPVLLNVSVQISGPGAGVSEPPGIDCGATCTAQFPAGTLVSLKPQTQALSKLLMFSGADCPAGSPQCF